MAQKYEIKRQPEPGTVNKKGIIYKVLFTLVKSNINCEKYTKNINLHDKAEIFFKKF